jgi:hypothetical protein
MAEDAKTISIQLTVMVNTESDAVKVAEILSRAHVGLALEGYTCNMMILTLEE